MPVNHSAEIPEPVVIFASVKVSFNGEDSAPSPDLDAMFSAVLSGLQTAADGIVQAQVAEGGSAEVSKNVQMAMSSDATSTVIA